MSRPKVLVTGSLSAQSVALLKKNAEIIDKSSSGPLTDKELIDNLAECDALICPLTQQITRDVFAACPQLKLVANVAVGYDNIDLDAATEYGVLITNTPGVLDKTTAELALGLLLACARRIREADCFVRSGNWRQWQEDLMLGVDVHDKRLGIVGFGRIGRQLARLVKGFNLEILYCRLHREGQDEIEEDLNGYCRQVNLDELLQHCDFISLHCPLSKDTYHLIGRRELGLIKPKCILINTSRGAIVDQQALIEALKNAKLAGAGMDVFENEPDVPDELKNMNQVVLTPHIGSASIETREAMSLLATKGLILAFSGQMPSNAVNIKVWGAFLERAREFFSTDC